MDISLNGNDTISLTYQGNATLLTKFFDKDFGLLVAPNKLATVKVGKKGNAAVSVNYMGLLAELTLRLLVGSVDDALINSIQRTFIQDPPSFALLGGQIIKRTGDGQGNVQNIIHYLQGGVPDALPEEHSNADGDEEQAVAIWKFTFVSYQRQIM